jgi:hypothetical protein
MRLTLYGGRVSTIDFYRRSNVLPWQGRHQNARTSSKARQIYASAGANRGPPPSGRWHPTATWSSSYHRLELEEKGRKQISSESCSLICNLVLELARIPRMRSEVRISSNASQCGFHCICDSHRRPRYRRRFDSIQRGQCAAVTSASLPRSGTASWPALTDDF